MSDIPPRLSAALADRYRFERELGRGGMATVYLAQDLKHKRPVALKVLNPELSHVVGSERFRREIETAAQLDHPHIVAVHDSGEAAGQLWYTMPYVEGESLRDRMSRERQLQLEDALRFIREVADALDYAHRHGVVHRDVKPENILLSGDHARVADFGIAKAVEAAGGERLTGTGLALGTPAYMSPEQASGGLVDGRSDQYSLGCVVYEMLAGEPPFTGTTPQGVIARRFVEPAPSVRTRRAALPTSVETALARALALEPVERFATATEFAQALNTADVTPARAASAVAPIASARPLRQRMHPGVVSLGLILLLGLGFFLAWLWSDTGDRGDTATDPKLLAVLPFENLGDSTEAYFAEGVSDAVRGKLAALPGLQVIAGTSSGQFRHTTKSPQVVARELGVRYLLVGKVRREVLAGDSGGVTVSTELVETRPHGTPTTLWQEPLEAPLSDVFRVQADIARAVAEALGVPLSAGVRLQLAQPPTKNLSAYQAFLRGEEISDRLETVDPNTLRRALTYYQQAVALDSSFVEAWARLSLAHSTLYHSGGTPTPAEAEAARTAAARTLALGPERPEGRLAQGLYYLGVLRDNRRALEQFSLGLRTAPNHVDLLAWAGLAEQFLGQWEVALEHFRRASALDPRSLSAARALAYAYLMMRRYLEALTVADRALALQTTPQFVHVKAMIHLAQGNLRQARADVRAGLERIDPTTLVATLGYGWDLYWLLEKPEQQLLLGVPPSAFDNNRAVWSLVLAQTYALREDQVRAQAYADTARRAYEEQLKGFENAEIRALYGVALAYAGRKTEAVREGERAVRLAPITRHEDSVIEAYIQHQLVRIYLLTGEPEKALDQLEPLLKIPYYLSPGWLRIDPNFDPLRGNPRFQRLVNGS